MCRFCDSLICGLPSPLPIANILHRNIYVIEKKYSLNSYMQITTWTKFHSRCEWRGWCRKNGRKIANRNEMVNDGVRCSGWTVRLRSHYEKRHRIIIQRVVKDRTRKSNALLSKAKIDEEKITKINPFFPFWFKQSAAQTNGTSIGECRDGLNLLQSKDSIQNTRTPNLTYSAPPSE